MLAKICIAACLAVVMAEPPVNNGYLPPPNSGYNYPKPNQPFPSPPVSRPPVYSPPPPTPPRPTYGAPQQPRPQPTYTPAPVPPRPQPTYTPAPLPPRPQPTYTPAPLPPRPQPTYGTPAPPRPTYGVPQQPRPQPPRPQPPRPQPSYDTPFTGGAQLPVQQGGEHDHHHHHEPGMPFDFNYAVKDDYYGTDYSHNAVSDGDVVKGEYKVLLPDGRLQIVSYTADWKNGYNAEIKYQGEPQFPPATGGGARSYGAPQSGGY